MTGYAMREVEPADHGQREIDPQGDRGEGERERADHPALVGTEVATLDSDQSEHGRQASQARAPTKKPTPATRPLAVNSAIEPAASPPTRQAVM